MLNDASYQERAACPVYTAIGVIEGRWKPMIFQRLALDPHGFGELQRAMPSVSIKVLARPGAARGTLVSPPRAPRETIAG